MKKFVWILAAASALLFAACDKYDDSALRSEIDSLKDRVSAVEKTLNETVVPKLNDLVEQLKKGELVVDVKHNDDGYVLYLTGGTTVPIRDGKDGETPVIGITKEGDIYYWTINGVVVTDSAGNKIPVGSTSAPVFRAREDGTLEYSVDNGKTWQEVSGKANVELEETDEAYILIFGETRITLPKAQAFTLKIQAPGTLVIPFGETVTLAYTILGAGDNEITEVDILNNGQGFDAEIEAETGAKGSISITNRTNSADAVIKVFVYATNHTGKSDIKAIVYKADQGEEPIEVIFEAVLDAELVPAAGGEIHLSVNSDEAYSVSTDADWISVATTKAIYEDVLLVTVAENKLTEQRSAVITVASNESDKVRTLAVLQEAAEEVGPEVPDGFQADWVLSYAGREESTSGKLLDWIQVEGWVGDYFDMVVLPSDYVDKNYDGDVNAMLDYRISTLQEFLAENTDYTIDDVCYDEASYCGFELLDPGTYTAYLIDVTADAQRTGKWGCGTFEIEEEEPLDEYNAIIGNYVMTSAKGYHLDEDTFSKVQNSVVEKEVVIEANVANVSYVAYYLYEGTDGKVYGNPSILNWDRTTGGLAYYCDSAFETEEIGEYGPVDFGQYGQIYHQSKLYYITGDGYTIASGIPEEDGTFTLEPGTVSLSGLGTKTLASFFIAGIPRDEEAEVWWPLESIPLPMTFEPVEVESSAFTLAPSAATASTKDKTSVFYRKSDFCYGPVAPEKFFRK